jgi:hypothetical protein
LKALKAEAGSSRRYTVVRDKPSLCWVRTTLTLVYMPPVLCVLDLQMGTLTDNIAGAVAELRQGRVEFKMDRTGIVHAPIGKAAADPQALYLNMGALTGVPTIALCCTVQHTPGSGPVPTSSAQHSPLQCGTPSPVTHMAFVVAASCLYPAPHF